MLINDETREIKKIINIIEMSFAHKDLEKPKKEVFPLNVDIKKLLKKTG